MPLILRNSKLLLTPSGKLALGTNCCCSDIPPDPPEVGNDCSCCIAGTTPKNLRAIIPTSPGCCKTGPVNFVQDPLSPCLYLPVDFDCGIVDGTHVWGQVRLTPQDCGWQLQVAYTSLGGGGTHNWEWDNPGVGAQNCMSWWNGIELDYVGFFGSFTPCLGSLAGTKAYLFVV